MLINMPLVPRALSNKRAIKNIFHNKLDQLDGYYCRQSEPTKTHCYEAGRVGIARLASTTGRQNRFRYCLDCCI